MKSFIKTWGEAFTSSQTRYMTTEESELFLDYCMSNFTFDIDSIPGGAQLAQIFAGRAKRIGLETTAEVAMFIASLALNPGSVIMYASALRYIQANTLNNASIDMRTVGIHCFPNGFLTEVALEKMWRA